MIFDNTGIQLYKQPFVVVSSRQHTSWSEQNTSQARIEAEQMVDKAQTVLRHRGCLACHPLDCAKMAGPSFHHLYGAKQIVIINAQEGEILVDDVYLRESILDPDRKITKGFSQGLMLT